MLACCSSASPRWSFPFRRDILLRPYRTGPTFRHDVIKTRALVFFVLHQDADWGQFLSEACIRRNSRSSTCAPCHSHCLLFSGLPVPTSTSCFLRNLYGAPSHPVRESPSYSQGGNSMATYDHAAMWQHQGDDLAECQREGAVFRIDLLMSIQGSIWCLAQRHLVRSQRPGGTHECRLRGEGVDDQSRAQARRCFTGKPPALRGLPFLFIHLYRDLVP